MELTADMARQIEKDKINELRQKDMQKALSTFTIAAVEREIRSASEKLRSNCEIRSKTQTVVSRCFSLEREQDCGMAEKRTELDEQIIQILTECWENGFTASWHVKPKINDYEEILTIKWGQ